MTFVTIGEGVVCVTDAYKIRLLASAIHANRPRLRSAILEDLVFALRGKNHDATRHIRSHRMAQPRHYIISLAMRLLIWVTLSVQLRFMLASAKLSFLWSSKAMRTFETIASQGFKHIATLHWDAAGKDFRLQGSSAAWKVTRNFIYAWIDRGPQGVLNVGHTGQTFSARFGDYVRWLNGKRKNDSNTPIRRAWLLCLSGCMPGQVEVWVRPSAADRSAREVDERHWIFELKPRLNRR